MGENSKIAWTDATFNHVRGCTKVSEGCKFCYAEAGSKRNPGTLGVWGPNGTRVVASEAMWKEPVKWDRLGTEAGERRRVFCASLADVFEDWDGPMVNASGEVLRRHSTFSDRWWSPCGLPVDPITMTDVRRRLFELIEWTPNLDWLFLTKRPENVMRMVPDDWIGQFPSNVWMGTTVENKEAALKRLPELCSIPARIRFISAEPLLENISDEIAPYLGTGYVMGDYSGPGYEIPGIHQVIVGGESGSRDKARSFDLAWARRIRDVCEINQISFFMKQMGSRPYDSDAMKAVPGSDRMLSAGEARTDEDLEVLHQCLTASEVRLRHPKGEDPTEWEAGLRIQQFPEVAQ